MPRGVPLSEAERDKVRARVFEAAAKLFLRQGFHETSIRQIAQAAGMGKATLYDYFHSKEEILIFFVERYMGKAHQAALEIAAQDTPAPLKLRRILRSLWEHLARNRRMALLTAREASRLSEATTRRLARSRARYRAILQDVIRSGVEEGTLRPVEPALAASALHSLLTMPLYEALLSFPSEAGPDRAEALADLYLHGLQAS
jgi:AcrR family transcriptional regulator